MVDDLAAFNRDRWNELAREGVPYSRPWLDLDEATARQRVDPLGLLGDLAGRDVLCLAGGGGQQSAAFGLLGASVTVLDLSEEQLARDAEAARHYGLSVRTIQGDMRDLSALPDDGFDVVWHAHSLAFIPLLEPVYDGVARVLQTGGIYHQQAWNPLAYGADTLWDGQRYRMYGTYREGISGGEPEAWDIAAPDGSTRHVPGPREFRHTLTATLNGLLARGFILLDVHEEPEGDPDAPPGSWAHFCSVAPPWLCLWAAFRPDLLDSARAGTRARPD